MKKTLWIMDLITVILVLTLVLIAVLIGIEWHKGTCHHQTVHVLRTSTNGPMRVTTIGYRRDGTNHILWEQLELIKCGFCRK